MKSTVQLQSKTIGLGYPVFIIAEIGVNHNGNIDLALDSIEQAKKAGADCVKFQTFKAGQVVLQNAPKAAYQLKTTPQSESQIQMLKKLELPFDAYQEIVKLCKKLNIIFLSTPYNYSDVDFLESLDVPAYKIASGQVIELSFLEYVAKKKKPIFLSTGMATLAEVDSAVNTILKTGNDSLILLQCTTNYPSRLEDANLLAIKTMGQSFHSIIGYSDHTQSHTACIASVALGASVIEKHFTLDKTLPGPDHSTSANPTEFAELVKFIRESEKVLGTGIKQPSKVEIENSIGMRRSIVANTMINAGETITNEMLTFKRPSTGINPSLIYQLLGRKARRTIHPDEMIDWDDIQR